jgi:hypothetical protein
MKNKTKSPQEMANQLLQDCPVCPQEVSLLHQTPPDKNFSLFRMAGIDLGDKAKERNTNEQ